MQGRVDQEVDQATGSTFSLEANGATGFSHLGACVRCVYCASVCQSCLDIQRQIHSLTFSRLNPSYLTLGNTMIESCPNASTMIEVQLNASLSHFKRSGRKRRIKIQAAAAAVANKKKKTDSNVSPLIEKNCFQREDEKKPTLNSSVELRAPFEALAANVAALQARLQFQEKLRLRDEHVKAQARNLKMIKRE